MARIAVIIDEMFEDPEYVKPAQAFKKHGDELIHVGLESGKIVKGKSAGTKVQIDEAVKDCGVEDFDALLIPGGYSPDHLRVDKDAVRFAREFMKSGKPVFAICHAPQLLITAQALKGRKATGWKSLEQDMKYAGAIYEDSEVVQDGNLITSRKPADIPAFIEASIAMLEHAPVH